RSVPARKTGAVTRPSPPGEPVAQLGEDARARPREAGRRALLPAEGRELAHQALLLLVEVRGHADVDVDVQVAAASDVQAPDAEATLVQHGAGLRTRPQVDGPLTVQRLELDDRAEGRGR